MRSIPDAGPSRRRAPAAARAGATDHARRAVIREVRAALMPDDRAEGLARLFGLLSDPTRLRIVESLSRRELCVHEISEAVGKSVSAVSHQLRLLRGARVVRFRRMGKLVCYSLDDEHVTKLFAAGLEHVEH